MKMNEDSIGADVNFYPQNPPEKIALCYDDHCQLFLEERSCITY